MKNIVKFFKDFTLGEVVLTVVVLAIFIGLFVGCFWWIDFCQNYWVR